MYVKQVDGYNTLSLTAIASVTEQTAQLDGLRLEIRENFIY